MDCTEARTHLLDRRRGRLDDSLRGPLDAHLADCADCRREDAADGALSELLDARLPRRPAPPSLRRALEARLEPRRTLRARGQWMRTFAAMAAGAAIAVLAMILWRDRSSAEQAMVGEAVNDYLRVRYSEHPVEIESGGIHQVKPWFQGRIDFAPLTSFGGDDEFPLQGGAVSYFVDRKAAAYIFTRRLHVVVLFVFRADGLPWPGLGLRPIGRARGTFVTSHGYHVALWHEGDLGYALVSDVNETDLTVLAAKIAGP